jgi:fructose-1,6-bisphosphatase/inositol monophosphatase family enzyme
MINDPLHVLNIIKTIAAEEIMPRFERLASHEITEKSPGDLVTIADTEAERRLEAELTPLISGSVVVGEEGVAEAPNRLLALESDQPVWIVDPVDGTKNFANGKSCFAVMVALCQHQQPLAAWIYDPVNNCTIHTQAGQGVYETDNTTTTQLHLPEDRPVNKMRGSIGPRRTKELNEQRAEGNTSIPTLIKRYRCVGREYMDLARGKLQFLRYGGNLKPWDHVPGVMIHRELGGYDAMTHCRSPYPIPYKKHNDTILLANHLESWTKLTHIFQD